MFVDFYCCAFRKEYFHLHYDSNINTRLSKHQNKINDLCSVDNSLDNIPKLLDAALIQIDEAIAEIKDYLGKFNTDTKQLTQLENRLDKLNEIF